MNGWVDLPEKLNKWKIVKQIGAGSFGVVYEAVDEAGEVCAIKHIGVPDTEFHAENMRRELRDDESLRRYYASVVDELMVEIKTMEKLKSNPNIVKILDYEVVERSNVGWDVYIVMELLQSLPAYRTEHVLTEAEVLRMGIDICNILTDCEKKHVLHRDIKPDNIMVDQNGTFKLGDFGVAKEMEKATTAMSVKGTFNYMAPEIYHGEHYRKTADIYSLALVLYRMVNANKEPFVDTGKKMTFNKEREEALQKRMSGLQIPPPVNASKELAEVLGRALEFEPSKRFARAEEFQKYLMQVKDGTYTLGEVGSTYGKTGKLFPISIDSTFRSVKYLAEHKRKQMILILAAIISVSAFAGSGIYSLLDQRMEEGDTDTEVVTEDCPFQKPEIQNGMDEKQVISMVEKADQKLWETLKKGELETLDSTLLDVSKEQLDEIETYYQVDQILAAKYTEAETKRFQEENTAYTHIVGGTTDWTLCEVLRYVAFSDKETADDQYHGDVVKSSMFYLVKQEEPVKVLTGADILNPENEYRATLPITDYPDSIDYNLTDGILDLTWLDEAFTYGNYSRVTPVAAYEMDNQMVFLVSAKNGLDEDLTIYDIGIEMKKYNRAFRCDNLEWFVEKGSASTMIFRFDLNEELTVLEDDEWIFTYNDSTGIVQN